ncbi:MAG: TolC family protein [Acidobacteria bacterium]|nr:TolC family protein [Acidobacteriota bacterium]
MTSLPTQVRAFAFGLLIAGLMLAAAARATHAQSFGTVVGERVAAVARQASRAGQPARRFDLTLDDVVQRALERNLDIAVQRIHPLVQDMRVAAAGAAFLPVASSGFDFNQETTPNRFVFDGGGLGGQPIVSDRGTYDLGVGQQVKWGGGRYDVTWDSTRSESTNIFSTFNPSFGANMTLQYTQPLLRGFRTDSRRTQLVVSRINRDISDIDLEETVVNTLADVSLAYWDLVYARAAAGVQRQAVALAEQLVQDNRVRVEVGTMAPIDVVAAQSEAAARRQLLAVAVETQRTSELALKELIVGGTTDELWNAEINPTDEPRIEAGPIDLQAAIRGALDRRTDVSRARRQLDVNEATVDNLRNSTLPALDLVGSYQLTGQGGPRLVPAGNSFEDIFGGGGGTIPGGYRDALDSIANADYPIWSVQLQMSYPLGRSADRAAYERARLELQQNRTQIRRIELRIASEVTNAALRIESIRERIEAATASRELAERQLEAEESKFEVGLSTNFFVLQSQRDLANARDAELRAILDYRRALIEFDRTQRASLGAAGIAVVGGAMGGGAGPIY